ncbi:MAG TPA: hypothetical protein VMF59_09055 [Bacteroidota bacterium]|nr:hypothetical protein [Bacteroidota bacterium]
MNRMRGVIVAGTVVVLGTGGALLAGCSSSPDEAQLKHLDELKKEYADLQGQVSAKEQTKATLEREIADKNARLKKCHDDEAIVKERLAK